MKIAVTGAASFIGSALHRFCRTQGIQWVGIDMAPHMPTAANPDSYLAFTSRAGSSGLTAPATPATLVTNMNTGQGVPVTRDQGGFVRLFFEAQGADGRTRAMWVDSRDGYFGQDFNAGTATTCTTAADYSTGGGCEPTVAIAVRALRSNSIRSGT